MNALRKLFMLLIVLEVMFSLCSKDNSDYELGLNEFKDPRDGTVYKTLQIGDQVWMSENLRATKYRNGDPIPNVTSDSQWAGLSSGAYLCL